MRRAWLHVGVAGVVLGLGTAAGDDALSGALGGMRYDNWWVATGAAEPSTTHPLYPPAGQMSGSATWRCVECHGWDYLGVDGAYGSGPHYTGIGGVLGSTLSPEAQFALIKEDHGYGAAGLSDVDIWHVVDFLQHNLVDTDLYIAPGGGFFGDPDDGRFGYLAENGYYNCAHCHGADGAAPTAVAGDDPARFLHKVRFSDPTGVMSSTLLTGGDAQQAADIGAYLLSGRPGPAYAGDGACVTCHADSPEAGFFDGYLGTGHPWKVVHTAGEVPADGTWPRQPTPPLPVAHGAQVEWSDVEYVIGNFYWQARFVDREGFLITGDAGEMTQWNLHSQTFAPFFAGQTRPFACGQCHSTGYDPSGNQGGLPGIVGTWVQDGVRCEACHGPSADHVEWPGQMTPPGGLSCAACHTSDSTDRIRWSNGFLIQHVQAESMKHSPHSNLLECTTCHDPHRSTVYGEGGVISDCRDCHDGDAGNNFYEIASMPSVDCVDCHMPAMARTAEARGPYTGDGHGHIWRIMTAATPAEANTYEDGGVTYWKTNHRGEAFVTLDYACLGCHETIGAPITLGDAAVYATNIHDRQTAGCPGDFNGDGLLDLSDVNLFVAGFVAGDLAVDLNGDGMLDLSDVTLFIDFVLAGCP